jgi:hypothetical protein
MVNWYFLVQVENRVRSPVNLKFYWKLFFNKNILRWNINMMRRNWVIEKVNLKESLLDMYCETQDFISRIKRIQDFLIVYIVKS